jgi:hypothetical protein
MKLYNICSRNQDCDKSTEFKLSHTWFLRSCVRTDANYANKGAPGLFCYVLIKHAHLTRMFFT